MDKNQSVEQIRERCGDQVSIQADCYVDPSVNVRLSPRSRLVIGQAVNIMRGTSLEVLSGGALVISDRVNIGENVYISAMSSIVIGEGAAISNMVDIHDHNHRNRTFENIDDVHSAGDDINSSGFEAAPITIEPFVTISNKVSITAGVRIGQNTMVGANAVVTRSLPPNCIAVGAPAQKIRTFAGPIRPTPHPARLRIAFFGTSIMQHLEAYAAKIFDQMNLPQVGEAVQITEWRTRGYVEGLSLMFSARWPHVSFEVFNYGYGGANIRKLNEVVESRLNAAPYRYDLILFSGGMNDVWRRFQGRLDEAVNIDEFELVYRCILARLLKAARRVLCLSETPVNTPEAGEMNKVLVEYNRTATRAAADFGIEVLDVWSPFTRSAELGRAIGSAPLWSDGVHLSDSGDAMFFALLEDHLRERGIIDSLLTLDPVERSRLAEVYPNDDLLPRLQME